VIQNLKPYPVMKDSGVSWLGSVPEHWELRRLRNLAEMRVSNVDKHTIEGEHAVRLCNYVDVYKNDHITPSMNLMRATATREEIERFRLAVDDVLITKDSETWNDIGVPALVRGSANDLVSGYHLAILRPFKSRMTGEFLFRALQSTGLQYQFHVEANGVTRYGLSHAAIKSVWLPVPSLSEQSAIARFLDHADRRIRRYIRSKQKLIKLLEEQKQAIIHRAVTRGLDRDVRLKPSGIEWLGEVPEHWQIRRIGRIAKVFNGTTPSRAKPSYWDGGTIPWLSSGKVNEWIVETPSEFVTEQAKQQCSLRTAPRGAVIVGLVGQGKTRAKAALLGLDACINQNVAAVVPRLQTSGVYLLYWFTASYKPLRELGRGGNQEALNCEIVGNWRVALPPQQEQDAICGHLETALLKVSEMERGTRHEIDLLREFRRCLIADVVTGKLDVRDTAARLPEEASDTEPLEEPDAEGEVEESAEQVEGVTEEAGA
jgi:type I restriction enzyme S subunit